MVNIKEAILNYTVNRWGRNRKSYVGATSESIRKCKPNNLKEWEDYYDPYYPSEWHEYISVSKLLRIRRTKKVDSSH